MKYKHSELLNLWCQGAEVEYLVNGTWRQMPSASCATKVPHFYVDQEYRLKPTTGRYRVGSYLVNNSLELFVVRTLEDELLFSQAEFFISWLNDWQEFTLEIPLKKA